MRERLSLVYGSLWRRAGGLGYEVQRTAAAFIFLMALSFIICMVRPELAERLADYLLALMGDKQVVTADGTLSAPLLFANNLRACMVTMLYGLLPFLYLPALALGMNAMMLGVMAAWYAAEGISPLAYLAALIPHGILELPALFLSFGTGLYICGQLTRRCRKAQNARPLWACMTLASQILLSVLVPLLLAASFVEAYVTPAVAALFH